VTPLSSDIGSGDLYFGYSGGTSGEDNTIEISETVGRLIGLQDGDLVQAACEYSFEKLKQIELEPLTPEDFEIVEKNCEFIEEQLLNQVGTFYDRQRFCIFMPDEMQTAVRLISRIRQSQVGAADRSSVTKCFFLTVDSELHI
jgi:hypothetical protein